MVVGVIRANFLSMGTNGYLYTSYIHDKPRRYCCLPVRLVINPAKSPPHDPVSKQIAGLNNSQSPGACPPTSNRWNPPGGPKRSQALLGHTD